MKLKLMFLVLTVILMLFSGIVAAKSPYGDINVYYNDRLLPGSEVAKPNLKIGEPFKVKIEMTLNQPSVLFIKIYSLGDNMYEVIEGPSEFKKTKYFKLLDEGTYIFEWTLKPTDGWAGGTLPVNFGYQINMPDEDESVVNSGFTIAVPYISTEHYEGDSTPPTTTTPDSPLSTESPNSIPAFTLLATALAIALAIRKQ